MTAFQSALLERHTLRVGKIFTAVAIFGLCLLAGMSILPAFWAMFFMLCLAVTIVLFIFTCGLAAFSDVFISFIKGWFSVYSGGTEVMDSVINAIPFVAPIVCGISIAAGVIACTCFALNVKRRPARVWFVVCVVCLILIIVFAIIGLDGNIVSIVGGSV